MKSLLSALLLATPALGHSAEEWKERAIYQIITDRFFRDDGDMKYPCDVNTPQYCGGTWKGISQKLDYIKGMGFNAIWISPIPQNKGTDFHGYAALNWEKVNEHFGTEEDLKNLVTACHEKDMWVMLDVVANHVAPVDEDFSQVTPFNKPEHYHDKCQINDFKNRTEVEHCRLANLPDLDQDNEFVRSYLKQWVNETVTKYDFDGLRVDTTPEVKRDFWGEYSDAAGVFTIGEVFDSDTDFVASFQGDALDATLNYPLYDDLKGVFAYGNQMYNLRTKINYEKQVFNDTSTLGLFLDNHDNQRFLHMQESRSILKNAMAFVLTAEGIPIMYYGTEQYFDGDTDPHDREALWLSGMGETEMYSWLAQVNEARTREQWWKDPAVERFCDDNFYAFTRGDILVALTNLDGAPISRWIEYSDYEPGTVLVNLLDPNDTIVVNADKTYTVDLLEGLPKIYKPQETPAFLQE